MSPVSCRLSATGIRFLVIHCPPRNWASLTVGLPAPIAGNRTPTGLSRFAHMRYGRGGCRLYPEDCGALAAGKSSPAVTRRVTAASPYTPVQQPTTRGFLSRGISDGSRSFTRPAFPLPVTPGWNGDPWASPLGFTPRRHRRRMPRWGQAVGHLPGLRHHQQALRSP